MSRPPCHAGLSKHSWYGGVPGWPEVAFYVPACGAWPPKCSPETLLEAAMHPSTAIFRGLGTTYHGSGCAPGIVTM
jgi:hypothetical protein